MRPSRFAVTVLLTCSTSMACGGGGGYQQEPPSPPPPLPPGETRFTLTAAIHELRDAGNNIVRKSEAHVSLAPQIWRQCGISLVYTTAIPQNLEGIDPTIQGNNIVRLGERFYATDASGGNHDFNWTVIENAGFRRSQTRAKGSDSYYSRMILEWQDGMWTTIAAGVTPVTTSPPENYSVIEPQSDGNNQLNLAHEIGHQLGLDGNPNDPPPPSGNIMCRNVGCLGTAVTGSLGHSNQLAPGTQCYDARDWGDFWNLFEEG